MGNSEKSYVLAKDLVFPAGTRVHVLPAGSSSKYGTDHASVLIPNGSDSTIDARVDLSEAISTGLVILSGEQEVSAG